MDKEEGNWFFSSLDCNFELPIGTHQLLHVCLVRYRFVSKLLTLSMGSYDGDLLESMVRVSGYVSAPRMMMNFERAGMTDGFCNWMMTTKQFMTRNQQLHMIYNQIDE